MSVTVTGIEIIRSDFRSAGSDYLLGNIFQKCKAVIDYEQQTFIAGKTAQAIVLYDSSFPSGIYLTDSLSGGRFADFNVGDDIIFVGVTVDSSKWATHTATILSKPDNNTIKIDSAPATAAQDSDMVDGFLYVTSEPTGCRFFYGLPENSEATSFNSKIDGIEQQYKYGNSGGIPGTLTSMTQLFKKSAHLGTCQIKKTQTPAGGNNYKSIFQIEHTFYINPFYLDTQLTSLTNNIAPSYFDKQKCLKYVFKIQSHYDVDDPNIFLSATVDNKLGNSGWFDENFNGGQTNYSISNLTYVRVSDSLALTGIENVVSGTDKTTISFRINNTTDTPFRSGANATKVSLAVIVLPEDPTAYQNINELMADNYCFDRAVYTIGGAAQNGDNYGGAFQFIENFSVTLTSSSVLQCSFRAALGADVISKIANLTNKNFLIVAQTEDLALGVEASDAVALKVDLGEFVTTVGDLITFSDEGFIEHPINDLTDLSTSFTALSNDELVGRVDFQLETANYNPLINSIDCQIVAKKTDGTEAILQENNFTILGSQLIGGVQNPSITQPSGLKVASSEIRENISIQRLTTLDSGTKKGFRIAYPFVFRWEDWEQLILAGNLPVDFYDTTKDFNGYNHDWNRLGDFTNWDIYWRVNVNLTTDEGEQTETSETIIPHRTFDENSDWDCSIASYDQSGNALTNGVDPYIKGTINTEIRAVFEKVSGSVPSLAQVSMAIRILVFEQGNYIDSFVFSSVYDRESLSGQWWKSLNADGKVEITKAGAVFTGKADLSQVNLPTTNAKYTVIARIYESGFAATCSFSLQTGSGAGITEWQNAGLQDLALSQFLFFLDGLEQTSIQGASITGDTFTLAGKAGNTGDAFWALCSNNAVTGTATKTNSIAIGSGFSFELMLMFVNGVEMTTKSGTSYSNPNFTLPFKVTGPYKAWLPSSVLVIDSVQGSTYTNAAAAGYGLNEILIFVDGIFMNDKLNSWTVLSGTIDFGFVVNGLIKIVEI